MNALPCHPDSTGKETKLLGRFLKQWTRRPLILEPEWNGRGAMGWVDRINRYFLDAMARRRTRAGVVASPTMLPLSSELMPQLVRLDLLSHDALIGETWVLLGTLADGRQAAIAETDAGWQAMRDTLNSSGRLNEALHLSELRLLADPHRKPLNLI
ncbi:hypothetical protein ACIGHN_09500 [Acidovorax sp. NPDC077693]|uniref:hypothetical protein n=1 Tax=Acidovorax sp. NPDC077693 TaxID=3363889 RepID=UPI0037CB3E07